MDEKKTKGGAVKVRNIPRFYAELQKIRYTACAVNNR